MSTEERPNLEDFLWYTENMFYSGTLADVSMMDNFKYRMGGWCRILAYVQLVTGVLPVFPLLAYAVLTLLPLFILTILYLFGTGYQKSKNSDLS